MFLLPVWLLSWSYAIPAIRLGEIKRNRGILLKQRLYCSHDSMLRVRIPRCLRANPPSCERFYLLLANPCVFSSLASLGLLLFSAFLGSFAGLALLIGCASTGRTRFTCCKGWKCRLLGRCCVAGVGIVPPWLISRLFSYFNNNDSCIRLPQLT